MNKIFILILVCCSFLSKANEIVMIEVYSLPFNKSYVIGIDKKGVRKDYDLGIKIKNSDLISSLSAKQILNNLKLSDSLVAKNFDDFRAFIIIRFKNGKSRKFYISGTAYIIENNKVFERNLDFLKMVYSFFPANFRPYYPIFESLSK